VELERQWKSVRESMSLRLTEWGWQRIGVGVGMGSIKGVAFTNRMAFFGSLNATLKIAVAPGPISASPMV
jgi:hypothetical protein